jgi:hypothetical protein
MTVNYIRNLKRTMNNALEDYDNGYRQCSEEMWKLIHSLPNLVPEQRDRLATRCRQMWTTRRPLHHPYQRRTTTIPSAPSVEPYNAPNASALKILINHPSLSNIPVTKTSSLSSSSSSGNSSTSLSPSSPKLWKPYM